jgi:hypothetical protein
MEPSDLEGRAKAGEIRPIAPFDQREFAVGAA